MKRMGIRLFYGCLVFLFVGCSTVVTSAGARVKVTGNPSNVAGCELVGPLKVSRITREGAEEALREQAAPMGGDTVLIFPREPHIPEYHGEAYRCGAR